jgi:hypothetical protein
VSGRALFTVAERDSEPPVEAHAEKPRDFSGCLLRSKLNLRSGAECLQEISHDTHPAKHLA